MSIAGRCPGLAEPELEVLEPRPREYIRLARPLDTLPLEESEAPSAHREEDEQRGGEDEEEFSSAALLVGPGCGLDRLHRGEPGALLERVEMRLHLAGHRSRVRWPIPLLEARHRRARSTSSRAAWHEARHARASSR